MEINIMDEHKSPIGRWLSTAFRHSKMFLNKHLDEVDLEHGGFPFLLCLAHHEGCRQEDLRQVLAFDKGTAARAISKLVQQGFVEKRKDPNDGRAYRLYTTEKAKKIVPQMVDAISEMHGVLTHGFSDEEKETVRVLLWRMSKNIVNFNLYGDPEGEAK